MMLATFACLLAGGICTLANSRDFVEKAQENMIKLMDKYPVAEPSAGGNLSAKASWDRLQSEVSFSSFNLGMILMSNNCISSGAAASARLVTGDLSWEGCLSRASAKAVPRVAAH